MTSIATAAQKAQPQGQTADQDQLLAALQHDCQHYLGQLQLKNLELNFFEKRLTRELIANGHEKVASLKREICRLLRTLDALNQYRKDLEEGIAA